MYLESNTNKKLRTFESLGQFFTEFFGLFKWMKYVKKTDLSPVFFEKIMLAVSGVTECAYCSFLHTQTALEKSISREEISRILKLSFGNLPENEGIGLLFAQHYADTAGKISPEAYKKALGYYGEDNLNAIIAYIKRVYLGNMASNMVVSYRQDLFTKKEKRRHFLLYLFCLPIANFIKKGGENRAKAERSPS